MVGLDIQSFIHGPRRESCARATVKVPVLPGEDKAVSRFELHTFSVSVSTLTPDLKPV